MNYITTIGLEIHTELSTKTKMYCTCKNQYGAPVNTNCCPRCMGMPGSLPKLNKKAVESAIKMGLACHCTINHVSKQDRKNYFYPDLPKAYQITQYDMPLCEFGYLDFYLEGEKQRVGIHRIHIEEDTAKLIHDDREGVTLIDFNRCGVPLIEIVTEPEIVSSAQAKEFLDAIRLTLLNLNVSDCKMEEGSIRCDVNVSVRPEGQSELGTRVEMKNVNTFSGAVRAIEFEALRQTKILKSGGTIPQETRRWDDLSGQNFVMRTKENANDYRYFPEPDIPAIVIDDTFIDEIKNTMPEMPIERYERYIKDYGLNIFDANLLANSADKAMYFEECVKSSCDPKLCSKWILGDVTAYLNATQKTIGEISVTPTRLVKLLNLIESNIISNTAAKDVLSAMFEDLRDADLIVTDMGLSQISDQSALIQIIDDVIKGNPKSVEDFRSGKSNAAGFLVGQCMKLSKGKANPKVLTDMILERLK